MKTRFNKNLIIMYFKSVVVFLCTILAIVSQSQVNSSDDSSQISSSAWFGALPEITADHTVGFESSLFHAAFGYITTIPEMITEFIVPSAQADQVFNDDLIVTFSECVGNDCVNGESFGFDTIKLKENNLRIYFQDTSTTASFPSNDWRIIINDSSNGGSNFFAVEDSTAGRQPFRVEAGARANSLYVEADGDIGIGTANPVVDLHVVTGDTPTLRLDQDGSSGWAAQKWDVAGNETNFFIRDATNGSKLPFRIRPGAPQSSIDIASDGDIGMGTSSPQANLHIRQSSNTTDELFIIESPVNNQFFKAGSNGVSFDMGSIVYLSTDLTNNPNELASFFINETDEERDMLFQIDASIASTQTEIFSISKTGDTYILGNLDIASSKNLKQDISEVSAQEAMKALDKLEPIHFSYKTSPDTHSMGFIAEDVPDIVATKDRKTLRPMDLVALLTKVTQEQQKTIETLSAKVSSLEALISNSAR